MEGRCKKHSGHKQARGVCPFCLKERLEILTASSSSSSTYFFSSMASSAAHSPKNDSINGFSSENSPRRRNRRKNTLLHLLKGGKEEPLRRSNSLAFLAAERKDKEKEKNKKKSKRSGSLFWTMFMLAGEGRRKERELEGLYHSKTVKERSSSRWALFA